MSFNNWLSSSSVSRPPLSITTNFNDIKQQQHHYAPIVTTTISHPLYNYYQQQHSGPTNLLSIVPSTPMIDHQVPFKYKENFHRNSTLKLRRCVALFLHLIGMYIHKNLNF